MDTFDGRYPACETTGLFDLGELMQWMTRAVVFVRLTEVAVLIWEFEHLLGVQGLR